MTDSKNTILIVDDQGVVVRLMKILMARTGAHAVTAGSGNEAIEKVLKYTPDVVVMDQQMPDMTGDKVTAFIRQRPELEHTKVVIVTGHDDEETRTLCMNAGADYFVTKPIQPNNLLDLIRSILRC